MICYEIAILNIYLTVSEKKLATDFYAESMRWARSGKNEISSDVTKSILKLSFNPISPEKIKINLLDYIEDYGMHGCI